MPAVAVPPAGIVTVWPLRGLVTVTVGVCPSTVSTTEHTEPAGMFVYGCTTSPAGWPAGMVNPGANCAPFHVTAIVVEPCLPAPGPAMVFVTVRLPGGRKFALAA